MGRMDLRVHGAADSPVAMLEHSTMVETSRTARTPHSPVDRRAMSRLDALFAFGIAGLAALLLLRVMVLGNLEAVNDKAKFNARKMGRLVQQPKWLKGQFTWKAGPSYKGPEMELDARGVPRPVRAKPTDQGTGERSPEIEQNGGLPERRSPAAQESARASP